VCVYLLHGESARAFYYSRLWWPMNMRDCDRDVFALTFLLSSILKREFNQKEQKSLKAHSSLRKFCISISVYLWYFFSLDLSLFRFWDFLLLLLLLRLIRRSLERKRETKRQRERIRFPKLFLSPGKKKTFKRSKWKTFSVLTSERSVWWEHTQRERERTERENKRVTFFNREREREREREEQRERERECVCLVRARSSIFFSVECFWRSGRKRAFLYV